MFIHADSADAQADLRAIFRLATRTRLISEQVGVKLCSRNA